MISQELQAILRCPACVSGPERRVGDDPGQLRLVHDCWLICQEDKCGRKYPIVEGGIPVMLIPTGDKWINTPETDLPVPPPAE
jgi:uncharacterized protein YbaR (Trm112 family)